MLVQLSNTSPAAKSRAEETQRQNNTNIALWGATAAIVTLAASYLSVPLYRMFCQVTLWAISS